MLNLWVNTALDVDGFIWIREFDRATKADFTGFVILCGYQSTGFLTSRCGRIVLAGIHVE
jgi:hypothetical protein